MIKTMAFMLASTLVLDSLSGQAQQKKSTGKVLFVLTSHDRLGNTGEKTGLWIEEFATPYYYLTDKGIEVTIASPKGGQPPIDPKSEQPDYSTPATKRFYSDKQTQTKLSKSVTLSSVRSEEFDAIFYPGGHGPMWDLAQDKNSAQLIESFYNSNKPVALVCHGPAALSQTKDKNGYPLITGKKVTAFTNTEEEAVQLTKIVPFSLEDMLKAKGANYTRGNDWQSFVVADGLLITGQNPASSEAVAEKLLGMLKTK